MSKACFVDEACDFLYRCSNGVCVHDSVFPLKVYPAFVYLIIPISCGLCNLSGNAMGMFKVVILMNLLRYNVEDATAIIQAIVIGAAIPNFIQLIMVKHPKGNTSLVNYNLILIFIPCCLYGSTLGSLMESFLPVFVQELMIIVMFTFFTISFLKKIRKQFKPKEQIRDSLLTTQQRLSIQQSNVFSKERKSETIEEKTNDIEVTQSAKENQLFETQKSEMTKNNSKEQFNQVKSQSIQMFDTIPSSNRQKSPQKIKKSLKKPIKKKKTSEIKLLRQKIKYYQKSLHLKDILFSFFIFITFELLVFFVQGKIPYLTFSKCTVYYPIGLVILTIATGSYLMFVRSQMVQKFQEYRKIKFRVDVDLSESRTFWKMAMGGFGAGFVQGTLGVGAGTFLMTVMLSSPIHAQAAAATSGFQILFTGSAALTQQFINNKITIQQALFFFMWTAFSGGIVTYVCYRVIKKMDEQRVKKILFIIITGLCILSLILVFPIMIQDFIQKGWDQMNRVKFQC